MRARSWRWLSIRITELLAVPDAIVAVVDGKGHLKQLRIPQTRLGLALSPPKEWR